MAAQGNQASSLHYFINELGLDIESRDSRGATPLQWASFSASEIALSYLVAQQGVNLNSQNLKGETALHQAVQSAE
jgi:ankyrin repeat protein